MAINRGEILKREVMKYVQDTGTALREISKKAEFHHSATYRHFKRPDLATNIIRRYGNAIGIDFGKWIPEMNREYVTTEIEGGKVTTTVEQALKERDEWKEKYIELLERHNAMLQANLSRGKE